MKNILLKTVWLSIKNFFIDNCPIHASALTYYTLLALVPLVALALGIAKGFDLDNLVQSLLLNQFKAYEPVSSEVLTFANNLLAETRGSVIAGVGVLILLFTLVQMLSSIEGSFNHIWSVKNPRTWKKKLSEYLAIIWTAPILIIIAYAALVFLLAKMIHLSEKITFIADWWGWIWAGLHIVPFTATTLLLFFFYVFLPNTKVHIKPAAISAFLSAVLLYLFQTFYLYFQLKISKYGAIYGSLAAFPLFLIWLQASWMIVLYGAELAFVIQHPFQAALRANDLSISRRDQFVLETTILNCISNHFHSPGGPITLENISQQLQLPYDLIANNLDYLMKCRLVIKTKEGFCPARNLENMDKSAIIEILLGPSTLNTNSVSLIDS